MNMKMINSHEPELDDWVSFLTQQFLTFSGQKDYSWLLNLNSYAHAVMSDECSPEYREKIMSEFGHRVNNEKKYFLYEN